MWQPQQKSWATIQHCLKKGNWEHPICICREHCGNFLHARYGCCLNKYVTSNTFYGFNFCYGLSVINKCFARTIYEVGTFVAEIKCCRSFWTIFMSKKHKTGVAHIPVSCIFGQACRGLTAVYISFNLSCHTVEKQHFNLLWNLTDVRLLQGTLKCKSKLSYIGR